MPWPESRSRLWLLLLAAFALPVVVCAALLLRPAPDALATADVGAVPAVAALPRLTAEPDGTVERLVVDGRSRAALVQDPLGDQEVRGLVVVLGPHSLSAARTAQEVRLDGLRARGYTVVYPSTLDGDWNAGRCCGTPQAQGVDDVAFLRAVRDRLLTRYALPPQAVGLVGYSTGGQMVYRTVCEDPDFAAAAVVVAGSLETTCRPGRPLPATLVVHGLDDSTVPWETAGSSRLLGYAPTPARASFAAYAEAGACTGRVLDSSDGRTLLRWPGCARLRALTVVGMPGTGHGWTPLGGSVYATRFLPTHLERSRS